MAREARAVRDFDVVENTPDFMRGMTIDTDRYLSRLLLPQLSFHDLLVDFLDLRVALDTGIRNILLVDFGVGILMRQDVMRAVAAGANRGDNQTPLEEPLAVNGHGVVADDVLLVQFVARRHLGAFFMTAAARRGDIHDVGLGRCV